MLLRVLMTVAPSTRSWNDCSTFERMQRHFPKKGVIIVFTIGFIVFVHLTSTFRVFCVYSCSQQPFFIRFYRTGFCRLLRAQRVESCVEIAFSSIRLMVFSLLVSWKSTWPRSHFLVTLLLNYYVTRERCLLLHDDTLGTTAHGVPFVSVAPLSPWCRRVSIMVGASLQIFDWHLFTSSCWSSLLSYGSVSICAMLSLDMSLREERQLKKVEWCVVVTTSILMDTDSCLKVRRRRSQRRLADPLSTIILKDAPCSLMSYQPE